MLLEAKRKLCLSYLNKYIPLWKCNYTFESIFYWFPVLCKMNIVMCTLGQQWLLLWEVYQSGYYLLIFLKQKTDPVVYILVGVFLKASPLYQCTIVFECSIKRVFIYSFLKGSTYSLLECVLTRLYCSFVLTNTVAD